MSNQSPIIQGLKIINIDYMRPDPTLTPWAMDHGVIFVDTCARKTWIGHRDNFANFPDTCETGRKSIYTGKDAYEFLLRLKCGLESTRLGETNIDGQLLRSCATLKQHDAENYSRMEKILDLLKADARFIRSKYINNLQRGTIEGAAKILADVRKGDSVMIIGTAGRKNVASQVTLDLIYAVPTASNIIYTSPDTESLATIGRVLDTENSRKRIPLSANLRPVEFGNAAEFISGGCHVLIDYPMGHNSFVDSVITGSWNKRAAQQGKMVHLRGCPNNMGGSSKYWKNAGLDDYFSPEDVRAKKIAIDCANRQLVHEAKMATSAIAEARNDGINSYAFKLLSTCGATNIAPQDFEHFRMA